MKKQITVEIPEIKDCHFRFECLPEDLPVKGNCSAIDEETDTKTENKICAQLESGNQWAWCCVHVVCSHDGFPFIGDDYLGCCSYNSFSDFKESSGYYEDMKARAYDEFCAKIEMMKVTP